MPAVADYPSPTKPFVWRVLEAESSQEPQGDEGRQLSRKANEAFLHYWDGRAEVFTTMIDVGDLVSYVSVPPARTFYVKTRYVFAGKGEPLPFELDDE